MAVTGAAGFLGSHLCEALLAEGCRVVGIDGFLGITPRELAEENLAVAAANPHFTLVETDLRCRPARDAFAGVSTVFHLAGRPGVRETGTAAFVETNVGATERVLAAAVDAGVRRVVFASSSSVYGLTTRWPSREDDVVAPASVYARTKVLAERRCLRSPIPAVILRYFTVYGPRQRSDMAFARFVAAALGGPAAPLYDGVEHAARDFTYVADAIDGTLRAWRSGRAGAVYNLAGGASISLQAARAHLERLAGRSVPCVPRPSSVPEPIRTRADLTRSRRELGYAPRTHIADGLREQLSAARAHDERLHKRVYAA